VKLTLGTAARPEVRRATARPGAADGGIGSTSENWGGQQRHLERATGGGGEPPTGDADRSVGDFGRCDTVWPKKGLWPVTGAAAGQGAAHSTSNQEDTGDGDAAFLETDRRQAIACFLPTNGHVQSSFGGETKMQGVISQCFKIGGRV
jgi:hypothetical protein